jgi:flagellar biosynthesis anti-sigma factor FlgM
VRLDVRIDPISQLPESQRPEATSVRKAGYPTQAGTLNQSADVATLSTGSAQIQSLKAQLQSLPDVRQERVQQLQKAINGGTYQVSDQQIADAIFSELFGAPPRS